MAGREPKLALDGGNFGTELIYRTLEQLPGILAEGGCALFEIDPDQAAGVVVKAKSSMPSAGLRIEKDLGGRDRLLIIEHD